MRRTLLSILAAAVSGVLWGLSFGRLPVWLPPLLSSVALVPLLVALRRTTGPKLPWFLGWIFGLCAWITGIPWIVYTLQNYGGLPKALSMVLLAGLAGFLGLYFALVAALGARFLRSGHTLLALLGVPAAFVGMEWAQSWLFGGFPWNLGAYTWIDVPGALPLSAWIGAWGVTFVVVMVNTGLALSFTPDSVNRRWQPAAGVLATAGALCLFGWATAVPGSTGSDASSGLPVRLLQPNVENAIVPDWQEIRRNYDRVFDLSRDACDARGALLVWPESAVWPYELEAPERHHRQFRHDLDALIGRGCPVILNSPHYSDHGELFNSAFLLTPEGTLDRYDKRELVPWGERIPLKEILPFVGKLARNAGEFTPGETVGLLPVGEEQLAMAICFESAFPSLVAESVAQGATLLGTISNDAWYGDSAARTQLFQAVRYRAAENRRPLIRAAITGITAVVGPDGSVRQRLPMDEMGVLSATVSGRHQRSLFSRAPWAVPVLCWLLVLGLLVRSFVGRRGAPPEPR
ncbi:MAG: apolipoprotein N-acyltransferase [Acidobacteriota bacterium]|nr:apolipoprotein N-acyltransferase [Acidobacteriota bacterium]